MYRSEEVAHNQNSMHSDWPPATLSMRITSSLHVRGDMLIQQVEVGCVGVVQFLRCTCCIISVVNVHNLLCM